MDTISDKAMVAEAGAGVTYSFNQKDPYVPPTVVDNTNPYWVAFKAAADKLGVGRDHGPPFGMVKRTSAIHLSPFRETEREGC
ncbi:hypothetical protein RR48_00683 [Papilio machaon]|uniref:Uncharacterized protein n=1 Tax=Papilio machaon TaxID=76193 RepID=A0A0N1PJ22_PAPMA|nr:hypothetical protein RR48_00683 [Papilio machaon]